MEKYNHFGHAFGYFSGHAQSRVRPRARSRAPRFYELGIKGSYRHSAGCSRLTECYFFACPVAAYLLEVGRQRQRRTTEFDAARLGGRDSLCLPRADAFSLALGDEGKYLQHQISDEGAHQILALLVSSSGMSSTHISMSFFLRQYAPLLLNFLVVAPPACRC